MLKVQEQLQQVPLGGGPRSLACACCRISYRVLVSSGWTAGWDPNNVLALYTNPNITGAPAACPRHERAWVALSPVSTRD